TGGGPTCRSHAGRTISISCATNITAIVKLPSRDLLPEAICSGRNSPRAPGQRATTSRRSARGASSAMVPDDTPSGAQGWFFNTRREKLKNRHLREAFIDAFDFEWTNKKIMYGSYERTHSVFQNSDMMAVGKPSADELALLKSFRGKVSDEVFGEP